MNKPGPIPQKPAYNFFQCLDYLVEKYNLSEIERHEFSSWYFDLCEIRNDSFEDTWWSELVEGRELTDTVKKIVTLFQSEWDENPIRFLVSW
jgi:hypothetical protein